MSSEVRASAPLPFRTAHHQLVCRQCQTACPLVLSTLFLQLVSAGRVFEVLRWAEEWKARADPSLVRHLVFGILEVSAPPYSPEFAGSMLR